MSTNLNTLNNSELFDIFLKAEKFNAYGSLYFRLRNVQVVFLQGKKRAGLLKF